MVKNKTNKQTNKQQKKKQKKENEKPLLLLFAFRLACSDFTAKYQFTTVKRKRKKKVTQELEILQSSAACSTTSSLDVVSNKVRLLEKNKNKLCFFFLLSFPVGIGTSWGGRRAWIWEFLLGWGCWG